MRWSALFACVALSTFAARVAGAEADRDLRHGLSISSGMMSYTQAGVSSQSGTNASNVAFEWGYFTKRDLEIYTSYRLARDAARERVLYQAGGTGVRYFPFTLGLPLTSYRGLSVVSYDFAFKPYFEGGIVLGRYLIDTVFALNAADFSSEFFGANFGGGVVYAPLSWLALDLKVLMEVEQGYGTLDFRSTTLFATLGLLHYL